MPLAVTIIVSSRLKLYPPYGCVDSSPHRRPRPPYSGSVMMSPTAGSATPSFGAYAAVAVQEFL